MGRIVISTNSTLDGISQDPTGDEGFEFGGWFTRVSAGDSEAWATTEAEEALDAAALLVGGRSYEWFAQRWVGRPGAWAETLNGLPKYVVRTAAGRTDWGPTTVLSGDVAAEVKKVKDQIDGDILIYASYELIRTLAEADLIDEIRLIVFPHIIGSGTRVFRDLTASRALSLVDAARLGDSLVRLTYVRQA